MGQHPRTQEIGGKMGALEDAIASGNTQAMAELSPLFASAQYNMTAPPGSTQDPRAPGGFTFADPAQLQRFMQEYSQRAGAVATGNMLERGMRERDQQQQVIMQIASKLDPELQAVILQRLGMQPPQGFQGPEKRKLESAKELATHRDQLGTDDREAKLAQLQARMEQQQQQFLMQQAIRQQVADQGGQRVGIQQQAEERKQQTSSMPSMPPKQAQAIIESMALQGASQEQMAAMAAQMGFSMDPGTTYQKGGFLGMGGTQVPGLGRQGIQSRDGQAAGAKAAPKEGLKMKSKSGKPMTFNQQSGKWEYDQ